MSSPSDSFDAGRARAEVRLLSEGQLRRLHAEGPAGLRPGAWEAICEELDRRVSDSESEIEEALTEKRYPALQVVVFVIKSFSVLILLGGVLLAVALARESRLAAIAIAFVSVWWAILNWAGGELITLQIDIEANTRSLRYPLRTLR